MTRFRLIAGAVGLLLIVLAILFVTGTLSSLFTSKMETRVAKGQAGASIESGAEATNTLGNVMERDAETDAAVKEGIDEIRNASEADRGLATQRAACRLRQYVNSERCARLRAADTAKSNPGR